MSIHLPSLFVFVRFHSPTFTSFIRQAMPLLFHPHFFFILLFLFSTLCFFRLFFYFWILNPNISFTLLSCFHSCMIDSVMSYSSSSSPSSFALPNLGLELSCETAYSWLLLLFDLIMLLFWLLFDLVLWKRKPRNGRKDKFMDYDLFPYLERIIRGSQA